jgi:hypothetical protein
MQCVVPLRGIYSTSLINNMVRVNTQFWYKVEKNKNKNNQSIFITQEPK